MDSFFTASGSSPPQQATGGPESCTDHPGDVPMPPELIEALAGLLADEIGQPLDLTGAAVQVLPTRGTLFGWVAVPTAALGSVEQGLNSLFGNVQIRQIAENPDVEHSWIVTVTGH